MKQYLSNQHNKIRLKSLNYFYRHFLVDRPIILVESLLNFQIKQRLYISRY